MSPTADRLRQQLIGFNPTRGGVSRTVPAAESDRRGLRIRGHQRRYGARRQGAAEQAAMAEFKGQLAPERLANWTGRRTRTTRNCAC